MENFTQLWPLINSGGIAALGMLVVMWIVRGTLIPRRHHVEIVESLVRNYDEVKEDRDYWRSHATRATGQVDQALVVADTAVTKVINGGT